MKKVGVVGLGLIGRQRLEALIELNRRGRGLDIVGVHDPYVPMPHLAITLENLIDTRPSLIIVSTPHDVAVKYLEEILPHGIQVLVEKPVGRSTSEYEQIVQLARDSSQLFVGLNYQYFEGIRQLVQDVRNERFGDLISLSIEMGHGGSPSDIGSWKLDPERAGGGALLDPGVHLLDLAATLAGESTCVESCVTSSRFWKTGIEEDALVVLQSETVPVISLRVSITQWRSRFRIEVVGTEGYGIVEGRGRSYGEQTYVVGQRWSFLNGQSQRESEEVVVTTSCETSFVDEIDDLLFGLELSPVHSSASRFKNAIALVDECRRKANLPVPSF